MKIVENHFKLLITVIICIWILIILFFIKCNGRRILSETYNVHRFYIGYWNFYDEYLTSEDMRNKGRYFSVEKTNNFKDDNMIFEIVNVGSGASVRYDAYYAVLYNDGTLKYMKGDMIADGPFMMGTAEKIYNEMDMYYKDTDVDYVYITAFGNVKRYSKKLSNEEIEKLLVKLNAVEQFNTYDDHFQRDTGIDFRGYYYNGNYYGHGNPVIGKSEFERNIYYDVYKYIQSLIGVEFGW